jgi:hypothetical protein
MNYQGHYDRLMERAYDRTIDAYRERHQNKGKDERVT